MAEANSADTETDNDQDESEGSDKLSNSLNKALSYANLAKELQKNDPDLLSKIGQEVVDGYENDDKSRSAWMLRNRDYMKLATQVVERKSWPWDGAANVKYPLLTTASLQFASRAYSSLIPSFDVVKAKVIGDDDQGQMTMLANKLSTHMSYQVMYEIEDWEESMDKLCFILPIVGTMFKKVYYSESKNKICSELLSPKDVVVNYYVKKLQNASRVTEVLWFTANEFKERQNKEEWLEYEDDFTPGVGGGEADQTLSDNRTTGMEPPEADDETPRKVITQCVRLDLDDDEYKEPYIVTVDYETTKVLSIKANFYEENIEWKDKAKKEVACITQAQWFVKFDFLPNPDGGFYGIGFGILLGGLNDMVNTITNQLIDAGTLANLQAGFIGRGLRDNKQKQMKFTPGEWKWVNNPGKDLKENVFPLPVKEPSQTLFNLLGTLVQSGKEVASVAEIFTGKMPGQNTPASTTMATIEQGLKVFTSIYKRIYRALGKEFQLIFDLSKRYMPSEITNIVGEMNGSPMSYNVSRFDYEQAKVKIMPSADPNMVSETQKLIKIQGLMELSQYQNINLQEMTRQALIYQGQEHIDKLMNLPPPQPPMEIQIKQMELQDKDKDRQLEMMQQQSEAMKRQSEIVLNVAKAKALGDEQGAQMLEMQLQKEQAQLDMQMKLMELVIEQKKFEMDMQREREKHAMEMQVKKSEAELNLTTKAVVAKQDIQFNAQSNQKQLEGMDAKHKLQMKQAKEKNASKGAVG